MSEILSIKIGHIDLPNRCIFLQQAKAGAVKAIGLDPELVVRHTLRHTVVSLLIQSGVDIHTVMNITGHKTQEMVLRYSHRNGQHIQHALDKLQSKIQGNEA